MPLHYHPHPKISKLNSYNPTINSTNDVPSPLPQNGAPTDFYLHTSHTDSNNNDLLIPNLLSFSNGGDDVSEELEEETDNPTNYQDDAISLINEIEQIFKRDWPPDIIFSSKSSLVDVAMILGGKIRDNSFHKWGGPKRTQEKYNDN